MSSKIEILAPAGGFDSVIAAVHSGADAVYIGAKQFSARASAHNFDAEELRECVRYCHVRGVKVHLALNTLIFDDEMSAALELVKTAACADIDALIVQDLGLVSLIRESVPDLPLHASTQLSVHTPYGAKALYEMGFERVVLSRELSLSEIQEIRDFVPEVELEVFVHGALCMCLSGQCWFSAMLGGRSANRGMCAQPCRLPMNYRGNDRALSLKDNGSLHYLRELQEIGIASAKIEGRMKRPEYVAAATIAAREARDNGFISEASNKRLQNVFSRTGFTDGYLRGKLGESMFGFRQKSDVTAADGKLYGELHTLYKDEYPRVPVAFDLKVKTDEPMELTASDGAHTVTVFDEKPVEKARNLPLSAEKAEQSLRKTGGTPYFVQEIASEISPDAAVSAASLNAIRREALEKLSEKREKIHDYRILPINIEDEFDFEEKAAPMRRAVLKNLDIFVKTDFFDLFFVDIFGLKDEDRLKKLIREGYRIGAAIPHATFGNEKEIIRRLKKVYDLGVRDLLAHNIAAVYYGKALGFTVHAGFGMNIANSYTLKWARDYGISTAELSIEMDAKRMESLHPSIPVGVIRYGNLPLMTTRNAPAGANQSCKNGDVLQDRKDEKFPISVGEGYFEILNCVPVFIPENFQHINNSLFSDFHFNVENSVEKMKNTLEKIQEKSDFQRKTHGLILRGVK